MSRISTRLQTTLESTFYKGDSYSSCIIVQLILCSSYVPLCRRRAVGNCWCQSSAWPLSVELWRRARRGRALRWRPTRTTPTKRWPTCSKGCKWWSNSRRILFERGDPLWGKNIRLQIDQKERKKERKKERRIRTKWRTACSVCTHTQQYCSESNLSVFGLWAISEKNVCAQHPSVCDSWE